MSKTVKILSALIGGLVLIVLLLVVLARYLGNSENTAIISEPHSSDLTTELVASEPLATQSFHLINKQLWSIGINGHMTKLTQIDGGIYAFKVAPDYRHILFTNTAVATLEPFTKDSVPYELWEYDVEKQTNTRLVRPDSAPSYYSDSGILRVKNSIGAFAYSDDGKTILYSIGGNLFTYQNSTSREVARADHDYDLFEIESQNNLVHIKGKLHETWSDQLFVVNGDTFTDLKLPNNMIFYQGCCGSDDFRHLELFNGKVLVYEMLYPQNDDPNLRRSLAGSYKVSLWDTSSNNLTELFSRKTILSQAPSNPDDANIHIDNGEIYLLTNKKFELLKLIGDSYQVIIDYDFSSYPSSKYLFTIKPPFIVVTDNSTSAPSSDVKVWMVSEKLLKNIIGSVAVLSPIQDKLNISNEMNLTSTINPDLLILSYKDMYWTLNVSTQVLTQVK